MFRDEKEAARARVRAVEADLERARADLAALEKDAQPADRARRPLRSVVVPILLFLAGAALFLAMLAGPYLLKAATRRTATLTWGGRVVEPGWRHVPAGAECRLEARVSYVGETTAEPWRVTVRCDGDKVFERAQACCSNTAESRCHLQQRTQGPTATYAARCDDSDLWIETAASKLLLPNQMEIQIDRWSAPTKRRLFERDGDVAFRRDDPGAGGP